MWGRRLVGLAVAMVLGAVWLAVLGHPMPRTPVGADGVGRGSFPVVEVAGLGSRGTNFAPLTRALTRADVLVLDFDPAAPGVQPLTYQPRSSAVHIAALAVDVVLPAIRSALSRAGLDPDHQRVDVVAHSTGGLLVRYLVEHGPSGVSGFAGRVDDLVLVAVPDHGSWPVWVETRGGDFAGLGSDMRPGSSLLDSLGYREPPGQVYTAIGGDPYAFRWLHALGGTGFDDQVPSRSPFLDGAANNVYPSFHGQLLHNDDVIALITKTLAATDARTGGEGAAH